MEDLEEKKQQLISKISGLPSEQMAALKEKISSMTDEDFEKFTSGSCIFCGIASGKIEAFKVYEDEDIVAFLDINPISKGHVLLITKKHIQFLFQMPDELSDKIFRIVKSLMPTIVNVTKAQGVNIFMNQGLAAGQNLEHFSINLVPRYSGDKVMFEWPRLKAQQEELENISGQIEERMSKTKIEMNKSAEEEKEAKIETEKKIDKEKEDIEKIFRQIKPRMS